MSLLDKYSEKLKVYTQREQETVEVVITNIRGTKDDRRVMIETVGGKTFFAFKNSFPEGVVPMFSKPINASITLEENGEYINVVSVHFDAEQLGKHNLVASYKNPVVL